MTRAKPNAMLLFTLILMDILGGAEMDLFVPSFPELRNQFILSAMEVEALLSVNFIGYCISLFFVGSLADYYGRKTIIIAGLIVFILGSICCCFGNSYSLLLLGRFLQGVGVSAPAILCFVIIADLYPVEEQASWMAVLNGLVNLAIGAAPVVGGYITMYFHWFGNFVALLIAGIVVLLMTIIFIPNIPFEPQKDTLLPQGYISIFKSNYLMLLMIFLIMQCLPYWVFVGMSPLLYIGDLGVSLAHFGYYQGIFAVIFGFGSIAFGFVMKRYDQQMLLYIAGYIFTISLIIITTVAFFAPFNPLLITLAFLPFVIGQIIPGAIIYPLAFNFLPEAKARVAVLIRGGLLLMNALSLQLAGYFYDGSFKNIGVIISMFIALSVCLLFRIIKHKKT